MAHREKGGDRQTGTHIGRERGGTERREKRNRERDLVGSDEHRESSELKHKRDVVDDFCSTLVSAVGSNGDRERERDGGLGVRERERERESSESKHKRDVVDDFVRH